MKPPRILSLAVALAAACLASCSGIGSIGPADAAPAPDTAGQPLIPDPTWPCGMADGIPAPEGGVKIFQADLKIDQIYDVGKTPYGMRQVIVLQGGTFSGEKISGTVMSSSLDFQLTLSNGAIEIEQVLVLRAADGRYIFARNAGTGPSDRDVRVVFDFEAPTASQAAWLNTGKYVGRRVVDRAARTMRLAVFDVSGVAATDATRGVKIAKPADAPPQPWDYRHAAPTERQGDMIVRENVTLAASQSTGPSKHGSRNIIPITGGALAGAITGKVLPGGADYQNLSTAPTIDARYLWQTADGQIIIVRNTGGFGGLVPTFETRVDGPFSWLNGGKYLSSNPGPGAGGVGISMYKSN